MRENQDLRLDLSESGARLAFPFPSFTWRKEGQPLANATVTRQYGYPSIFIESVQPSDAGNYTLSAVNYASDRTTLVGSDTGSFTLNVLSEYSPPLNCAYSVFIHVHVHVYIVLLTAFL